jgi:hypothetical protein
MPSDTGRCRGLTGGRNVLHARSLICRAGEHVCTNSRPACRSWVCSTSEKCRSRAAHWFPAWEVGALAKGFGRERVRELLGLAVWEVELAVETGLLRRLPDRTFDPVSVNTAQVDLELFRRLLAAERRCNTSEAAAGWASRLTLSNGSPVSSAWRPWSLRRSGNTAGP